MSQSSVATKTLDLTYYDEAAAFFRLNRRTRGHGLAITIGIKLSSLLDVKNPAKKITGGLTWAEPCYY